MRKGLVVICLMFVWTTVFSQNWNEFFRQKRTQIRYLWQQIAALQVYIELGQKGYGIYQDGLTLIGDIKNGEFTLHKNYFASLDAVNPYVAEMPEIKEMIEWHKQIIVFDQSIRKVDVGTDRASVSKLFEGINRHSSDNLRQLALLTTDGHYQLKDEERITQIRNLHRQQRELYQFARANYQDVTAMQLQQSREEKRPADN